MQHVTELLAKITAFIYSTDFFYYHGYVLAGLWFIGSTLAILARRISIPLHALGFFLIDTTTLFFLVGAWIRVYPYIGYFFEWSLIKQGHIIGGTIFMFMLIFQHVSGVISFLENIKDNPVHRKFGFYVTNFARFIAIFGFLLVKQQNLVLYLSIAEVVLLIASAYATFIQVKQYHKKSPSAEKGQPEQKRTSVKRD